MYSVAIKWCPVVLADLMNGEDIRMIQAGGGLRLTLETAKARVVASEFAREQLDRDKTTERGVLRQVHFPHTAGAEQGADRVTSKTSPDRKGHKGFARPILCVNYAPSGRQLILATPLLQFELQATFRDVVMIDAENSAIHPVLASTTSRAAWNERQ